MAPIKTKRPGALPAFLAGPVGAIAGAADDAALLPLLSSFDAPHAFEKQEERSLLNWIEVLDALDVVLARRVAAAPTKIPFITPPEKAATEAEPRAAGDGVGAGLGGGDWAGVDLEKETPPLELVLACLRASLRLVRNASHDSKHLYSSTEHLCGLLADASPMVIVLSLEVLLALFQRAHRSRTLRAVPNTIDVVGRLFALSHGFGGKEIGLGMVECCAETSETAARLPEAGAAVKVDFRKDNITRYYQGAGSIGGPMHAQLMIAAGEVQTPADALAVRESQLESGTGPAGAAAASVADSGAVGAGGDGADGIEAARSGAEETRGAGVRLDEDAARTDRVDVADVRTLVGDDAALLTRFMASHKLGPALKFPLLCAVRRARAFVAGRVERTEHVRMRLLAISCLALFQPTPPVLPVCFALDSEFVSDVVSLAKADPARGLGSIPDSLRMQALRCLQAVCPDRHRFAQLLTSAGVSSHHGILPSLLRAQVAKLTSEPEQVGGSGEASSSGVGPASPAVSPKPMVISCLERDVQSQPLQFAEAVIGLVHAVATCTSGPGATGAMALVSSGALGAMVPLLSDRRPHHARVVSQAVRAMECIIETTHSSSGSTAFRDSNGLALLIDRIVVETGCSGSDGADEVKPGASTVEGDPMVGGGDGDLEKVTSAGSKDVEDIASSGQGEEGAGKADDASSRDGKRRSTTSKLTPEEAEDEEVERAALEVRGESRALYDLLGRRQFTPKEALAHESPSSSTASRGLLSHSSWTLLRGLMRLLLLALSSTTGQSRDVVSTLLPKALRQVLARPFHYGGSLFAMAATVAGDIAHAEPTATEELVKAGISKAILRSIQVGLPPSGEAIKCVPNILAALSLAPTARAEIVSVSPLQPYVARLATPFYGRAMHGETPVHIGNSLDELMRHVESMRSEGSKALVEFLNSAATFVKSETPAEYLEALDREDAPTADAAGDSTAHVPERISVEVARDNIARLDKMRLTVANNAARLAGFAQGSSEHQSAMVRMKGLERMLDLRYAPANAARVPAGDGKSSTTATRSPSVTPHNTITSLINSFRSFCSRHGPAVLRCVFEVTKVDAAEVLDLGCQLNGCWLEEEEAALKHGSSTLDGAPSMDIENVAVEAAHVGGEVTGSAAQRQALRKRLTEAVCRLRVDVVILSGLSRSGPGSSAGAWEAASGSQVAAMIASVERAARWHIAHVYTGLALQSSPFGGREGDLCSSVVMASADPALLAFDSEKSQDVVRFISSLTGCSAAESSKISSALASRQIAPSAKEHVRKEVTGCAWALVTFAVSAQTLYSTLSRGLTYSSRRFARDPANFGASTRALATTIGRIFSLHLKAAESLWDLKVLSSGDGKICAAWDYIRGVLIEMKGCIFDDATRRPASGGHGSYGGVTQALILRWFLAAGGGEALLHMCRPAELALACFRSEAAKSVDFEAGCHREIRTALARLCSVGGRFPGLNPLSLSTAIGVLPLALQSEDGPSPGASPNQSLSQLESQRQLLAIDGAKVDDVVRELQKDFLSANQTNAIHSAAMDSWNMLNAVVQLLASCPGIPMDSTDPSHLGYALSEDEPQSAHWSGRQLVRTSQASAIEVVRESLDWKVQMQCAANPRAVYSSVLTFFQRVARTSEQLCREDTPPPPLAPTGYDLDLENAQSPVEMFGRNLRGGRGSRRWRARGGRTGRGQGDDVDGGDGGTPAVPGPGGESVGRLEGGSPIQANVDEALVVTLTEMGFPASRARAALRRVAPNGVEHAIEWLSTHADESEGELPGDVGDGSLDERDEEADSSGGSDGEGDDDDDDDDGDEEGVDDSGEAGNDEVGARPGVPAGAEGLLESLLATTPGDVERVAPTSSEEQMWASAVAAVGNISVPPSALPNANDGPAVGPPSNVGNEPNESSVADRDVMRDSSVAGTASDRVMGDQAGSQVRVEDSPGAGTGTPPPGTASLGTQEVVAVSRATAAVVKEESRENIGEPSDAAPRPALEPGALLSQSAQDETNDLSHALDQTTGVSARTATRVVKYCQSLIHSDGETSSKAASEKADGENSQQKDAGAGGVASTAHSAGAGGVASTAHSVSRPILSAVSKDEYEAAKTKMFEDVEPFTRMAMCGDLKGPPGSSSSSLGVELLLAMEQDGFLGIKMRKEYAALIASAYSSTSIISGSIALLKTGAIWAHQGGYDVRRALADTGICDLAFSALRKSCQSMEDDAVRPIEKLSISEVAVTPSGSGDGPSALSPKAKFNADDLRKVNCTLLLLDAFVCYGAEDSIVAVSRSKAEDGEGGGKKSPIVSSREQGLSGNRDVVDPSAPSPSAEKASMTVDTDDKGSLSDEAGDVQRVTAECEKQIEESLKTNGRELSSFLFAKVPFGDLNYRLRILDVCVRLLRAWSGVETGDALLAVLQLIGSLTKSPEVGKQFYDLGGVSLLLSMRELGFRPAGITDVRLVRSYARTILRHVVEDPVTLCEGMEVDLHRQICMDGLAGSYGNRQDTPSQPVLLALSVVLSWTKSMVERDPVVYTRALSKVAKLSDNNTHVLVDPTAKVGISGASEGVASRGNVAAVVDGLVNMLAPGEKVSSRRKLSGKLPKVPIPPAGPGVQLSAMKSPRQSAGFSRSRSAGAELLGEVPVFPLETLAELVATFPACASVFLLAQSPSPLVEGSALDFVVQRLLPAPHPRTGGRTPDVIGSQSAYLEKASAICRDLLTSMCRQGTSSEHVIDSLTKAASLECSKSSPRPGAIMTYAECVQSLRRPSVMRSFLKSGIADSLLQSLGKLDLGAAGMTEVLRAVLGAVDELGNTSQALQRATTSGNVSDEEFDRMAAASRSEFGGYSRRNPRSLFETLQSHAAESAARRAATITAEEYFADMEAEDGHGYSAGQFMSRPLRRLGSSEMMPSWMPAVPGIYARRGGRGALSLL